MTWVMAGVAGVNLISGLSGAKKKKKAQAEQMAYNRSLRLDPVSGQFGGIEVNDGKVDAGAFGDMQNMFTGGAGDVMGGIDFGGGLSPEVSQALFGMQSRLNPNVNPMMGGLMRGGRQAGAMGGAAFGDVMQGGEGQGDLMQQLFGQASGLAGQLGQSFDSTRNQALSTMRSQAMPENQRAVDSTLSRLFSQGRLGTTGGADIIGRLAEAQNQQDLGFQQAAGNEARAASADVQSRFGQVFGAGNQALQQAFGRFTGATGLGADLGQMGFGRQMALDQEGFSRAGENLQAVTGLESLPTSLQSGRLGLVQNMMGGASGIQDMIMQAFGGALNKAQAGTNVRVAGAGLNNATMNSPNFSASPVADAFGSLSSGMLSSGGGFDLSKIFNRRPGGSIPTGRGGSWG